MFSISGSKWFSHDIDLRWRSVLCNSQHRKLLGFSSGEFRGLKITNRIIAVEIEQKIECNFNGIDSLQLEVEGVSQRYAILMV